MNVELKDDLLLGAAAIAEFMGIGRRQVYHMVSKQAIPCFNIGETIAARKSSIMKWIERMERGE